MTTKHDRPNKTRASRWLRVAVLTLGVALLMLAGLYVASPWLFTQMAPDYADRLGVKSLAVETGYPGLGQISVHAMRIESETYIIEAERGSLRYQWPDIRHAKLDGAAFERVHLTLRRGDTARSATETPDIEALFNAVPVRQLSIDELRLDMPEIGFVGTGKVLLSEDALSLALEGLQPEIADRFQFVAELTKAGAFTVLFSEKSEATSIDRLSLRGNVRGEAMDLSGNVALDGYALTLVSSVLGLPQGSGTASAAFETVLPWPLPESLRWQDIDANLPTAVLDWRSGNGQIDLKAIQASAHLANGAVSSTVSGTAVGQLSDGTITAEFPPAYALHIEPGNIQGGAGLRVNLQNQAGNILSRVRRFSVRKNASTRLEFDAEITATIDNASAEGQFATTLDINTENTISAEGNIDYSGTVAFAELVRSLDTTASIAIEEDTVKASGTLTSGRFDSVTFAVTHNLDSGSGRLDATDSLDFNEPIAASLFTAWDKQYDLDAGQVDTALNLVWPSAGQLAATLGLTLKNAAGHYDEYLAAGINGTFRLQSANATDAGSWNLEPTMLSIQRVDIGLPISNVTVGISWSGDTVAVGDGTATLLGGRAATTAFDYSIDAGSGNFDVILNDVLLEQVLALEGDDIRGSGKLDGTLPVFLRDNQARVDAGLMEAQPPGGLIQLTPTFSGPTGQPGLDFALLALTDFNYEELRCEIDYAESGDLLLGVRLKGRNPDVEKGRPIIYNLNISENIPVLLESLRLQDQVTRQIEKKAGKK
jgi:hypothetical protein